MPKLNPNQMVVEGREDQHAVVHLMRQHVDWPNDESLRPVEITSANGVETILGRYCLQAKLKQTGLQRLAIMLDADNDPLARWQSLRSSLVGFFPSLPAELPLHGLVASNEAGLRLGIWIMPDNLSSGMLESFLTYLVPQEQKPLFDFAKLCAANARHYDARYSVAHSDKAILHTWLAWQDPPGERFGLAMTKRLLDPGAPYARSFVDWFIRLFELQATTSP